MNRFIRLRDYLDTAFLTQIYNIFALFLIPRHIMLSSGPSLSEHLWHVSVAGVERALGVTMYNLRLLMALFHANSDNFYGDIGQVKVATRKDCKVVDCLRLRQMAQQVSFVDLCGIL